MTDHAAKARETLEIINNGSWTNEQIHAISGPAQVHATLALVEEQRTANQIAWLAFRSADGTIPASDTDVFLDVAAHLGLTPTTPGSES